ncbi:MAG: tetratricopeptide repeat protein [Deltaproteobacteria bacterium]|nr:tetratricopeptide repeat protein [Deltaproteobacteria bacterium]
MHRLPPRQALLVALAALAALVVASCAPHPAPVTLRVIDGRVEETSFVSPTAYESYLRAQLALHRGDAATALPYLKVALAFDPDSAYLHTQLALALAKLGRRSEALHRLGEALRLASDFPDALLLQGDLHRRAGELALAEGSYARCVTANPAEPAAYLRYAQLLERRGAVERARQVLQALVQRSPHHRAAQRYLARLCLGQLDYPCAGAAYEQLLQHESDADTLMSLAHVRLAEGRRTDAVRLLREALDRSGAHPAVAGRLLEVFQHAGDRRSATDLLQILEQEAGDDDGERAQLVELMLQGRHYARALALLEERGPRDEPPMLAALRVGALAGLGRTTEALKLARSLLTGPQGPLAASRLARQHDEARVPGQGEAILREGLARHPNHPGLIAALSRNLSRQGKHAEAIELARRALAKGRAPRALTFALAAALEQAGQWVEAVALIRAVLRESPNDAAALNFIGFTLADRRQDLDGAERAIRRALRLEPTEGYIMDSLGWLHYRRGRLAEAERVLTFAVRVSPEEPELLTHLGEVHAALKRLPQAIELFRRAASLSKDGRLTARIEERLKELLRGRLGAR